MDGDVTSDNPVAGLSLDEAVEWYRATPTRVEIYRILSSQALATGMIVNAIADLSVDKRSDAIEHLQSAVRQLQDVLQKMPELDADTQIKLDEALRNG